MPGSGSSQTPNPYSNPNSTVKNETPKTATVDKHIQTQRPTITKHTQTSKGNIFGRNKVSNIPVVPPQSLNQPQAQLHRASRRNTLNLERDPTGLSAPGNTNETGKLSVLTNETVTAGTTGIGIPSGTGLLATIIGPSGGSGSAKGRNNGAYRGGSGKPNNKVQSQTSQTQVRSRRIPKASLNPNKIGHHRERRFTGGRRQSQKPKIARKQKGDEIRGRGKGKEELPPPERDSDLRESEEDDFEDYSDTEIAYDDAEGLVICVPSNFRPIKPFPKEWTTAPPKKQVGGRKTCCSKFCNFLSSLDDNFVEVS